MYGENKYLPLSYNQNDKNDEFLGRGEKIVDLFKKKSSIWFIFILYSIELSFYSINSVFPGQIYYFGTNSIHQLLLLIVFVTYF